MRFPFNPFYLNDILNAGADECNHEKGQGPKIKALQWVMGALNRKYHLGLRSDEQLERFLGMYTGETQSSVVGKRGQPILHTTSRDGNTIYYSGKLGKEVLEAARAELNRYSALTGENYTLTED